MDIFFKWGAFNAIKLSEISYVHKYPHDGSDNIEEIEIFLKGSGIVVLNRTFDMSSFIRAWSIYMKEKTTSPS